MTIEITHSRAEGTLIHGTRKADGSGKIIGVSPHNFRFSRNIDAWYLPHSRDKSANTWKIDRLADALRAADWEVTVTIDDTTPGRDFAEAEEDRYDRADDRADRYSGYADNAAGRSDAAYRASHGYIDGIPAGQPILVGHHSERGHRKAIERSHNAMGRSVAEGKKADYWVDRAEAAEKYKGRRESIPTTLRRIDKLEAEVRGLRRRLEPVPRITGGGFNGEPLKYEVYRPGEEYVARINADIAQTEGEIAYWKEHVAKAEANGRKIWRSEDFIKGDYALIGGAWWQIKRVSKRSITTAAILDVTRGRRPIVGGRKVVTLDAATLTWTDTRPYDEISGKATAAEMAEAIRAAEAEAAEMTEPSVSAGNAQP